MKFPFLILTCGLALGACAVIKDSDKEAPKSSPEVIGRYDDVVGHLNAGEHLCTIYASGPNMVTTAYHCLDKSGDGDIFDVEEITLELASGRSLEVVAIDSLLPKKDLARLEVAEKFVDYYETANVDPEKSMSLVSYDQDKEQLVVQNDCKLDTKIEVAGVFTYSCESAGHYSGSPLMQSGKVVGLHLGYKPKIDRRVAMDFGLLDNNATDILEVEFAQEGCHSRAHIRGGVFDGHSRAHVRGCSPGELFREYILGIKEEIKLHRDDTQSSIDLISTDTQNHQRLHGNLNTAWDEFMECYEDAKARMDRDKALNCQAAFKAEMDVITAELKVLLEGQAELKKEVLTEEARVYVDETHRISLSIVEMWDSFKGCLVEAISLDDLDAKNRKIKVCWGTMKERITSIRTDIDALQSDPFPF